MKKLPEMPSDDYLFPAKVLKDINKFHKEEDLKTDNLEKIFQIETLPVKEKVQKRTPRTYGTSPMGGTVEMLQAEQREKNANKRMRVRYPFEFYQDELEDVEMLKRQLYLKSGVEISMSKLVRKFVDEGISNLKKELGL